MTTTQTVVQSQIELEKIRLTIQKLKIEKENLRHKNIMEEIEAMKKAKVKVLYREVESGLRSEGK